MRVSALVLAVLLAACRQERMFEVSRVAAKRAGPCADDQSTRCPTFHGDLPPSVEEPRVLHRVEPKLSEAERRRGITGEVILQVGIRRDGTVGGVCVLKPLPCGLSTAAVDAVRQWRFEKQERDVVANVSVYFPPPPSTAF